MYKRIKCLILVLSFTFSGVFFYHNISKDVPLNKSLQESYKIQKMNLYPPKYYRLANIIEKRPEFTTYFRLEKNFTEIFNFSKLYSNYWELAVLSVSLLLIIRLFLASPVLAFLVCLPQLTVLSLFQADRVSTLFLFFPVILFSLISKHAK